MPANINVRPFERRHLNRVVEIEHSSFGKDAWPASAFLEYWRDSPDLFLTARLNRRIAGYAVARTDWRGAELESIAVDPRYRGQGVAQALIDAMLLRLRSRKLSLLLLMVSTTNEAALRFYQAYGFVRIRLVRRYYGPGRDAWRMRLKL
jgi:[ribosomal protein S18]-alanine N-acetyltransferase